MPVARAAADIAVQRVLHLGRRQRGGGASSALFGFDQALHGHHHPGAAEAALGAVVVGQSGRPFNGLCWH